MDIEVQNMVAAYSLFFPEDYWSAKMDDINTKVIDDAGGIRALMKKLKEDSRMGNQAGEPWTPPEG